MGLLTNEQIEKLKKSNLRIPHVSHEGGNACIGCSACAAICSDVFELNDDGLSVVKSLDNYEEIGVDDAISACPVNSISWK